MHWKCFPNCCTSSHTTTVGPSHWANGRPCRQASSSSSCLKKQRKHYQHACKCKEHVLWAKHGRMIICTYMKQLYGQRTALVKMWGNGSWISRRVLRERILHFHQQNNNTSPEQPGIQPSQCQFWSQTVKKNENKHWFELINYFIYIMYLFLILEGSVNEVFLGESTL